ncbi:DsRNase 4 [Gryllus bimaculatus]|nr:DsRNase 4 [Gryllus bimaculatus]
MAPLTLVLLATALLGIGHVSASCSFRHSLLPTVQPLILASNDYTDVRRVVKTDSTSQITVEQGDYITLVCPGPYNYLSGGNVFPQQLLKALCVSGSSFLADGRTIDVSQVACYSPPTPDVAVKTQGTCGLNTIAIDVGYNIPAPLSFFLKLYEVCYDPVKLTPMNARHLVVPGSQRSASAPYSAYLLPIEPAIDYFLSSEIQSFTLQLDAESARKYVNETHYLETKQLVPAEDFVFSPMQLSTFFYFNTVPLWNDFISVFWNPLESSIRQLTYSQGELEIYTGIVGVATLPDSIGHQVSMFLHAKTNELFLPLPAFLSKAVVNSKGQQVIFLQMQHVSEVTKTLAMRALTRAVCARR